MKLKLIVIAGRPVSIGPKPVESIDRVEEARRRFGRPFAHEPGSTWEPRTVPLLTAWMQGRARK